MHISVPKNYLDLADGVSSEQRVVETTVSTASMTIEESHAPVREEIFAMVEASKSTTAMVQSLIEGTTPLEPKFNNFCNSGMNPATLWIFIFDRIYPSLRDKISVVTLRPEGASYEEKAKYYGTRFVP
jgi:hypothetical protein